MCPGGFTPLQFHPGKRDKIRFRIYFQAFKFHNVLKMTFLARFVTTTQLEPIQTLIIFTKRESN